MNNMLLLLIYISTFSLNAQIDKLSKTEKRIADSLSKVYNKKIVGYTTINGKITHIQYIKNGKEFEMPLTGFRIEKPVIKINKKQN